MDAKSKIEEGDKKMKDKPDDLRFREVGKGFIMCQTEGIVGRMLTQTYVDQNKKTYVKIRGEYVRLTEQHSYLAA